MNPVAAILNSLVLYRYSLVLALAGAAGVCFFMACCNNRSIPVSQAAATALTAVLLSLPLARLVYWYGRPDSFSSFFQMVTASATESYALAGAFAGCILAVLLVGGQENRLNMLDCLSVAGCGAIALGRLGCFFTETDRGQIMTQLTSLPWAYPVANVSGQLEYRFAVFLFQAAFAAVLGLILGVLFFRKNTAKGDIALLFTLLYSASQILLDSTRYDSLYLRSNGFVSMVQVLSAIALVSVMIFLCVRTVRVIGFRKWMIPMWIGLTALFGGTGYMEYYVQRHGREAAFSYSVMGALLACTAAIGILLWHLSRKNEAK